jgi:hypothetical protein
MRIQRIPWRSMLALGLGTLLTACGGDADPSGAPPTGASLAPSTGASADPTNTNDPSAPAAGFAAGAVVVVIADSLRVREAAGTTAGTTAGLELGAVLKLEEGPVAADGFDWYRVTGLDGTAGWVAAGDEADAWLASVSGMSAARVLELEYGCDVVGPVRMPATTILEDGTVIANGPGGTALEVARLSAAGLATIQSDVVELPALQRSADYTPTPLPGAEPPGHGACQYRITIGPDPEPIVVSSIGWFGDEEEAEFYEPSPERRVLDAVANNLIEIRSVLDDSMWVDDRALPYVATSYALWLTPEAISAPNSAVPFEDLGFGRPWHEVGEPHGDGRCALVPPEVAFDVIRALRAGGQEAGLDRLGGGLATDAGEGIGLLMAPQTPLGRPACDDANF